MAKYFPVKLIQCTMVLVFMPFLALAQSYDLSGTIRTLNHRWTGNPIATAKIDIDSGKYMAFTDSAGQYLVKNVPTGTHSIRFSKIGYRGFLETISLTKNAIFNVSLPDTMQTISIGTDTLQVKEIKELFRSNGYDLENTSFWIRDSLTIPPVFLSQANYLDSNTYRDSIGSFTADWHDAKKGSMEHILQRKLFLPNTDSVYTRTHNGYIIRCNSNNNTTGVLDNSANIPYIVLAISKLTTSNGNTMMHEVGRAENYQTVSSRSSIMNANSEGHPMNLTDYVLY